MPIAVFQECLSRNRLRTVVKSYGVGPAEAPFTLEAQTKSKRGHLERENIEEEQRHRVHGMDKVKVVLQEVGGGGRPSTRQTRTHNVHGIEARMRMNTKIEIETKLPRTDAPRVPIAIGVVIFPLVCLANDACGGELKMNARRLPQPFH